MATVGLKNILLLVLLTRCVLAQDTTVTIDSFTVTGTEWQTSDKTISSYPAKTIRRFFNIKYGTAGRWEDPQLNTINEDIDATTTGPACFQRYGDVGLWTGIKEESEDCLQLNVFTPKDPSADPNGYAVMVWFHGGGFGMDWGGDPMYYSDEIAKFDVVVVTVNYRLGLMGFACSGNSALQGNYGVLDQLTSLKWVKQYITHFGGNPEKVTIFGQSAGGASIGLHLISPLSNGDNELFQQVIEHSGGSATLWSVQHFPERYFKRLADLVGCGNEANDEDTVQCLKQVDAKELMRAPVNKDDALIPWAPVVDKDFGRSEPFLHDIPWNILANHDYKLKPLMAGVVSEEGLSLIKEYTGISPQDVNHYTFENLIIPTLMEKANAKDPLGTIYDTVLHEYKNWAQPMDKEEARISSSFVIGDAGIVAPTDLELDHHEATHSAMHGDNNARLWKFVLNYKPYIHYWFEENCNMIPNCDISIFHSNPHAIDLGYIFGMPMRPDLAIQTGPDPDDLFYPAVILNSTQDQLFSERMIQLWTNFAKDGEPTKEPLVIPVWKEDGMGGPLGLLNMSELSYDLTWKPYSKNYSHYLSLDVYPTVMRAFRARAVKFWNEYLPMLYKESLEFNNTPPTTSPTTSTTTGTPEVITVITIIHEEPNNTPMYAMAGLCCGFATVSLLMSLYLCAKADNYKTTRRQSNDSKERLQNKVNGASSVGSSGEHSGHTNKSFDNDESETSSF